MAFIHPTAFVEEPAKIREGCRIDAFAVVEADVEFGRDVHISAHAVVHSGVRLADGVQVGPQSVVGGAPQDLSFDGTPTEVTIGARTVIREFVTIHRATGSSPTSIGGNSLIMGQVHIGHDCIVGSNVIIAQGTKLAGHVHVGDRAVLGGMAGIHQWVHIGESNAIAAGRLPAYHRDPFDRMLVAQAAVEGLTLVSRDESIARYDVDILKA